MGKEAQVQARLQGGAEEGRLQWESPRLIFRGATRVAFQGDALKGLKAEGGDLVLTSGERFTLGEPQAARWAEAILNPPGRLDKLGVKPGQKVAILNLGDPDFETELSGRAPPVGPAHRDDLDILFYGADSQAELDAIPELIPKLAERGAVWIVSLKGKAAKLKDIEVMAAAKAHGLVDNKVCALSETRTALRFTRRKP
ncbi:hypothetical protein QO010_004506 [Caulobacter ginsengisoli]|uniref:DUF3052 domain-containing protein n=1 Tax=Caulobacter ginsengisoli TaxID=400775 RepID=A0ABU0IZD8_9CAUL|nr:DUF3052 domain-containing protein [Caulobacter ginsengisoli]MDQ0466710.1 hypothetical protein [Caulobacter ginsengisoli]